MEKNLKIEKLSDIVAWADGIIRDCGCNEENYKSDAATAYCHVKAYELWKIRDAALKGMERHSVYTNALNKDIADKAAKIELLEKEIEGRKAGYYNLKDRFDTAREIEDHWKQEYETLTTNFSAKSAELNEANNKINDLKKELEETCTCKELDLKGHQRREMSLVNSLADKNDEIKKLKEEIEDLKKKNIDDFKRRETDIINQAKYICELKENTDYYKDQERIRTDQLRATERKVEELWGLINELKKDKKEGYDYAREGFKLYVKNTLAEAEGNKNEANEIITETVRSAYTEWSKEQKEEETEVNDIPCGEDAIE